MDSVVAHELSYAISSYDAASDLVAKSPLDPIAIKSGCGIVISSLLFLHFLLRRESGYMKLSASTMLNHMPIKALHLPSPVRSGLC